MRVYIAGPYTKPDPVVNIRNTILAADKLLMLGHQPFIPHLTHLWHMVSPKPYEDWLTIDLVWLAQCECVLRLPGDSAGADLEVAEAERLGIHVYYSVEELLKYAGI